MPPWLDIADAFWWDFLFQWRKSALLQNLVSPGHADATAALQAAERAHDAEQKALGMRNFVSKIQCYKDLEKGTPGGRFDMFRTCFLRAREKRQGKSGDWSCGNWEAWAAAKAAEAAAQRLAGGNYRRKWESVGAFWLINLCHVWTCVALSKEIPSKCNKPDRFRYRSLVSYVHICWFCQVLHRGQWCLRPPEIHLIWESWETQRTTWLDRHQNRWILLNFPGLGRLESRSWDWSPPEDWVDLESWNFNMGNPSNGVTAEVTRALAFTVASGAAWHELWRRWFRAGACPSAKKLWFVSRNHSMTRFFCTSHGFSFRFMESCLQRLVTASHPPDVVLTWETGPPSRHCLTFPSFRASYCTFRTFAHAYLSL